MALKRNYNVVLKAAAQKHFPWLAVSLEQEPTCGGSCSRCISSSSALKIKEFPRRPGRTKNEGMQCSIISQLGCSKPRLRTSRCWSHRTLPHGPGCPEPAQPHSSPREPNLNKSTSLAIQSRTICLQVSPCHQAADNMSDATLAAQWQYPHPPVEATCYPHPTEGTRVGTSPPCCPPARLWIWVCAVHPAPWARGPWLMWGTRVWHQHPRLGVVEGSAMQRHSHPVLALHPSNIPLGSGSVCSSQEAAGRGGASLLPIHHPYQPALAARRSLAAGLHGQRAGAVRQETGRRHDGDKPWRKQKQPLSSLVTSKH